jgi:hypothetical protein
MATQVFGPTKTFKAIADYRSMQFHIVYLSAEGEVTLATGATQFFVGTLENKPNINELATVLLRSGGATGKVKLGGTVTVGAFLTSDGSGHAIATTSLGDECIGRALAGGDAADVIEYMPMPSKYCKIT